MINKQLHRLRKLKYIAKGQLLKIYLQFFGCSVGKGLKCKNFPIFRTLPKGNFSIGDNVNIGYRITFDSQKDGFLEIGNRVNLTQDIVISSCEKVSIGDDCLIAENVSIRDGDHSFELYKPINQQPIMTSPISIENDVWIASGVRVLKGVILPSGCIIAANSVVLKKSKLKKGHIYGGSPVKLIGKRE